MLIDRLFFAFNLLTTIVFIALAVYPLWAHTVQPATQFTPFTWGSLTALGIWYGYLAFGLWNLIAQLRKPDWEKDYHFLYYLLGLVPVYCVVFMLVIAGATAQSWG